MFKVTKNGITKSAKDFRWRVLDIDTSAIEVNNMEQLVWGRSGSIDLGTTEENTSDVTLTFERYIDDLTDYEHDFKRDVKRLFYGGSFTLELGTRPNEHLNLKLQDAPEFERIGITKGRAVVKLKTVGLPYFIGNKLNKTYTNLGTIQHDTQSDVPLDVRYTDLEIKITIKQSATFVELLFDEVGRQPRATFRVDYNFKNGDVLIIKDGTAYINDKDVIESTNFVAPVLKENTNSIGVRGITTYTMQISQSTLRY